MPEPPSRPLSPPTLWAIILACAGAAPAAAAPQDPPRTFAGRWATSWGPMTLLQAEDGAITGTYGFGDDARVAGAVDGNTLAFEWTNSQGKTGEASVTLWEGGDHFGGASGGEAFFGGYRLDPGLPDLVPGTVVSGQSGSMLNVHARAPRRWNGRDALPCLVILHGSNMTARDYVQTIAGAWPDLADRYLVVGFDGERLSPSAKPGDLRFNYTYINFGGPDVGPEWARKQSPGLVAAAMKELRATWPISHSIIGGHSQGGFLTWVMALHYPDLFVGAFPMSCNLLVQCEPDFFDDEALIRAQHGVALAPIHGRNDRVVGFSGSAYARERMLDAGFPRIRLFDHPTAAHMFARLPVPQAIEWIEALTTDDVSLALEFADECLSDELPRDALAALERAAQLDPDGRDLREFRDLRDEVEKLAADAASDLLPRIQADENGAWIDDYLAFRDAYGPAEASRDVMAAYAALRKTQAAPAEALFQQARSVRDQAERKALYRELATKYYASKWFVHAREWAK